MPMLSFLLRVCRKKTLVTVFVSLVLFLILGNVLYFGSSFLTSEDSYVLHLRKLNQPFNWNLEEEFEAGNFSDTNLFTCRNSVQGRTVIADDKGFVCPRSELLGNGCCNTNSSVTEKHACSECDKVKMIQLKNIGQGHKNICHRVPAAAPSLSSASAAACGRTSAPVCRRS